MYFFVEIAINIIFGGNEINKAGFSAYFTLIDEGLSRFEAEDAAMDRYTKVARGAMDWHCYQEILEEKNFASFQPSLQQYFKKIESPARDPVFSTLVASFDSPSPPTPPLNRAVKCHA